MDDSARRFIVDCLFNDKEGGWKVISRETEEKREDREAWPDLIDRLTLLNFVREGRSLLLCHSKILGEETKILFPCAGPSQPVYSNFLSSLKMRFKIEFSRLVSSWLFQKIAINFTSE
jgi:hypothetical protein